MKKIGSITDIELSEIMLLQQRKNALQELYQTNLSDEIRNHVISDLALTQQKISDWWVSLAATHNWTYTNQNCWHVDFETKEVFLE